MCGFVGVLKKEGEVSLDVLADMNQTLRHRGPNDAGVWVKNNIGLAHARLSIHDLSQAGHQPMMSASGRFVIIFNGEIYNYQKIRKELLELGVAFKSDSDTEVLVNAIEVWGLEKTLKFVVGMFAFACWDQQERKLYLARDRFGEKPLYYGKINNDFVFSSELKAIIAAYKPSLSINRNALSSYLRYAYVPTPYSIFENVGKLEPGMFLILNAEFEEKKVQYWSATEVAQRSYANPLKISFQEAAEQVEEKLKAVLADQMLADVSVGAFLSGGIDSSLVVALMQSISNNPVKTFSIGFHETSCNEAPYAEKVARHLGTLHTELYINSHQALEVIPSLAEIYDEPFADSSQIPTFIVSQLAKQHVTVSLSGDGGDELFGGYNRYFFSEKVRKYLLNPVVSNCIKRMPDNWMQMMDKIPQRRVANFSDKIRKMKKFLLLSDSKFPSFYNSLCSQAQEPDQLVINGKEYKVILQEKNIKLLKEFDPISWMMLMDVNAYMSDDILTKVDRAAMGVSLETRIPFLDHHLFELAWRLPLSYKVSSGMGKKILREILYKYVPKAIVDRPKMGFGIPCADWLRGDLKEWAGDLLQADRLKREGFFNEKAVQVLWREHQSGKRNWQASLWSVLMFQAWLEKWS